MGTAKSTTFILNPSVQRRAESSRLLVSKQASENYVEDEL